MIAGDAAGGGGDDDATAAAAATWGCLPANWGTCCLRSSYLGVVFSFFGVCHCIKFMAVFSPSDHQRRSFHRSLQGRHCGS